ncbi:MAG: hypothetical protein Q8M58_00125, partial [Anaerolineales bacterium]|nr:hypothetical protein [Anaerolineales bacterium]
MFAHNSLPNYVFSRRLAAKQVMDICQSIAFCEKKHNDPHRSLRPLRGSPTGTMGEADAFYLPK